MSIGRISTLEFDTKEAVDQYETAYKKVHKELFPSLELLVNIKTGPTSILSIALYPDYESAASNLPEREKFKVQLGAALKDSSFQEGDVTYFYQAE